MKADGSCAWSLLAFVHLPIKWQSDQKGLVSAEHTLRPTPMPKYGSDLPFDRTCPDCLLQYLDEQAWYNHFHLVHGDCQRNNRVCDYR